MLLRINMENPKPSLRGAKRRGNLGQFEFITGLLRFARNDIKLLRNVVIIIAAVFGMCALSGCKQKQQQQPQVQPQTQQAQQTQTKLSPCLGGSNSSFCPIPINND